MARRGVPAEFVESLLNLDEKRRELLPEIEGRRAEQNAANDEIAQAKRSGGDAEQPIKLMRAIATEVKQLDSQLELVQTQIDELVLSLPNLPDPSVPDGTKEEDAEVVKIVGDLPQFDFEPKDHLELGVALDVIDMEKAAAASGSRFAYLKGDLVMVEFALVQYALSKLRERGLQPIVPPVLVREDPLYWTGFLPTDRAQIYEIGADELYLTGTSEVTLAALHSNEILERQNLPLRYAGFSTCFRREAGAAGKDTRGIFRVHQFDKVEMFSFVLPDASVDEHERILGIQEEILSDLAIPYRVVNIAAGDLGASAAKKYDCEAWIPSQERYRELTSCSNTTDYQARRLRCRFRDEAGTEPVHTLNGTAVAVGRTIVAIMENFQQGDGSVAIPAVLHGFGAPAAIGLD